MEALLQGRPADTEEEFLAQVQQEVDQVNVELRQVKGRNKEMRDELGVVIEAVCGCIADFAVKQREVNAELASIKGLAVRAHHPRYASSFILVTFVSMIFIFFCAGP